ncbi:hypothetical protein MUB13_03225 [Pseudomonas aeruginosa]|uniref:hypothetical protein n=1 Tax=Pseudomonas TaxID=286 RepID=UPI000F538E0E|nr:hypothetical protein [Pseudomonas aeruginosa]EJB8391761.1 hypothetical protein [Pseudomonas aeruginosa]ELK4746005.1 hypothetical protein [Pseudomonas aeruginosa]MBH3537643.1 hypothetical protein [Pseudomonas aeruginosa]MBM2538656.1 hypothetical protein [Pseudomonas aeruginosa]MBX6553200.1 hypothetical protein [Pseudomonas aeruginosa]
MELTAHATQRCSQRGIRLQQIDWLIAYGRHVWNRGARVYFFDRAHFRQMLFSLTASERQLAEKTRNSYVVVKDDQVITAGHRQPVFCANKPGSHHHRRTDWRHGASRVA